MLAIALNPFGDKSFVLLMKFPAALLIKPVIGLSANNSSTEDSIAKESLISKAKQEIFPPVSSVNSFTVSSKTDSLLPQITTSEPCFKKCLDISFPNPEPPPVTRILCPFNASLLNILIHLSFYKIKKYFLIIEHIYD